jgi:glycosyltransferase involved in cell wall biosynthesis
VAQVCSTCLASQPWFAPRAMKRIVHIITGLGVGGAERMVQRLVAEHRKSYAVESIVISLTGEGVIADALRADGFRVEALRFGFGPSGLLAFIQLVRLLRALRPDLVQTWLHHSDLIGGLAARLAGVKAIAWNIRGVAPGANRMTAKLIKLNAGLSKAIPHSIVCCGEAVRDYHVSIGYDRSKMITLPNGYDIDRFIPSPAQSQRRPQEALIVALGRNDILKDYPNLLRAVGEAASRVPALKCHVYGRGCRTDSGLAQLADDLGITSVISFHDEIADVREALAHAAIFCSSSLSEGFPNVIAEAMAMGVPCVATDAGDARIIIGDSGIVVPISDPAALSDALVSIATLADNDYQALSYRARKRIVENYEMSHVAGLYLNHYYNLIQSSNYVQH